MSKNPELTPKEIEALSEQTLARMINENKTLQEVLNVDQDILEEMYSLAYSHYMQGKYQDAYNLFYFIHLTAPTNYKFTFGFASCCHQLQMYNDAVVLFAAALEISQEDPTPLFYMADSFEKLGMTEESKGCFEALIKLCGEREEFKALKEQSEALSGTL